MLGVKGCERSIIGGKRRDRCRQGRAEKAIAWSDEVGSLNTRLTVHRLHLDGNKYVRTK